MVNARKYSNVFWVVVVSAVVVVLASGLILASRTYAHADETEEHGDAITAEEFKKTNREELKQELQEKREKIEQERKERLEAQKKKQEERKAEAKEKFDAKRLEACEKREESINKHMDRISNRVDKQIEVFDKISERVQKFYTDKQLNLESYDVLVEDVASKKLIAEEAVASLKDANVDFKCESEDPLKVSEAFKAARDEAVVAMKDYKTSVKNLIVGVSTAAEASKSDSEGSES